MSPFGGLMKLKYKALEKANLDLSNYFIESTYKASTIPKVENTTLIHPFIFRIDSRYPKNY